MSQILVIVKRRIAALPHNEDGTISMEHGLLVSSGGAAVGALAFSLADSIEKAFHTVLSAMP